MFLSILGFTQKFSFNTMVQPMPEGLVVNVPCSFIAKRVPSILQTGLSLKQSNIGHHWAGFSMGMPLMEPARGVNSTILILTSILLQW